MASKTLTISVPEDIFEYLKEDALLSPSKIFQVAVQNIKDNRENLREELKKTVVYAKRYEVLFHKAVEFITLKGLSEDWRAYKNI